MLIFESNMTIFDETILAQAVVKALGLQKKDKVTIESQESQAGSAKGGQFHLRC